MHHVGSSVTAWARATRRLAGACAFATVLAAGPALADKIKNPTAVFAGLDKITGRIIAFDVATDETVQFGALQITPKICYTRPPTEAPNTTAFVEVDEVTFSGEHRRIFSGWLFAASPGLHGVEHAIYDLWITDCRGGTEVIPEPREPDRIQEATPRPDPNARRRDPAAARAPGAATTPTAANAPAPAPARAPVGIEPPRGVPVEPRAPTQRFFPTFGNAPVTNAPRGGGFDPARSN